MNTLIVIGIALLFMAYLTIKLKEIAPEENRTLIFWILAVASLNIVLGIFYLFKGLQILLIQLN